jgi:hypothetical protein
VALLSASVTGGAVADLLEYRKAADEAMIELEGIQKKIILHLNSHAAGSGR